MQASSEEAMEASQSRVVTMRPAFSVSDWDAALPLMQSFMDETSGQPGSGHHDWTRSDDRLFWRSTFDDADAMLANMSIIEPLMASLLSTAAELDRFVVAGPTFDLERIQNQELSYDIEFYDSGTGFQTGSFNKGGIGAASPIGDKLCSSHPQFTITDWDAAKPLMQEFINRTAEEDGCLHFGWAVNEAESKVQWHGDYADGNALAAHFERTLPLINDLLDGPAKLTHMEVHGPLAEIDKAKQLTASIDAEYHATDDRVKRLIDRFEATPLLG